MNRNIMIKNLLNGSKMVKRDIREQARELRKQGHSIREITTELGVSKGSVSLWVRDIELTPEQHQALKEQQYRHAIAHKGAQTNRRIGLEKRIAYQEMGRERIRNHPSELFVVGCMLYWAEGAKTRRNGVHFANSDPNMQLLFIKFLRQEFQIPNEKFRLQIHCHTKIQEEVLRIENYWMELLQLKRENLIKTLFKKGSNTRKNILANGVSYIYVNQSEIVQQIFGAIQEYVGFENPDWLG
jgi:AcrR family transcriptional regulator